MPTESLEPSPFNLNELEATSRIAAKIYHERMEQLDRECKTIRDRLATLDIDLAHERSLRTQYQTYYRATSPMEIFLQIVCSLLTAIVVLSKEKYVQVILGVAIVVCFYLIYRVSRFKPTKDVQG